MKETADQAASAARRIVALFVVEDQRRIEALGRPAASVLRVFQHMQRNPIVSIPATAQKVGTVSAPHGCGSHWSTCVDWAFVSFRDHVRDAA